MEGQRLVLSKPWCYAGKGGEMGSSRAETMKKNFEGVWLGIKMLVARLRTLNF